MFNVGNPANRTTVGNLAQRIKGLLRSDSEIVHVDGKEVYGPMYMEAESFEKVPALGGASELGWEPEVGLDELILETADHYRTRVDYRQTREERQRGMHAAI